MTRFLAFLRGFHRDRRGLALTEFALASPLVITLGLYGLESANLALAHMKVAQVAANLADTTSRIGIDSPLSLKIIREADINDAFQAVRLQGGNYNIGTNGRVILYSLENDAGGNPWVHWQRCLGKLNVAPTYTASSAGLGPTGAKIKAPTGQAVMFVEVQYDYQPLISNRLLGAKRIKSTAAFIVRDPRDLTDTNNPNNTAGAPVAACTLFNP